MKWKDDIFKKNDIRGIYQTDFDLTFVRDLAFGFIRFVQQQHKKPLHSLKVAVGHDARLSSPEIAVTLADNLKKAGSDVLFLGMTSTPVCFSTSSFFGKANASIMITASHNPKPYNGFKFLLNNKNICCSKLLKLKEFVKTSSPLPSIQTDASIKNFSPKALYISFLKKEFTHLKSTDFPPFVIDCGNGVCGPYTKEIFKFLHFKIHWLFTTPDGTFPYHLPDPSIKKNLIYLRQAVVRTKSSFGAAFDGDGDRLVIIGPSGKIFHGDELIFIFLSHLFKKNKKSEKSSIVVDVKCANWFFDFLKTLPCLAHISPSGHSLIRQKTLETKAIFGGEYSGHFFFSEKFPFDDGLYCLLRLIQIIIESKKTIEELLPKNIGLQTQEIRIPINNIQRAHTLLRKLKRFYQKNTTAECLFIDGARVHFINNNSWGLVRLSNTQKEFTFRFGAKTSSDLKALQQKFYQLLKIPLPKKPSLFYS